MGLGLSKVGEESLDSNELVERLERKVKTLSETVWENKCEKDFLEKWLSNFKRNGISSETDVLHSLYLLSQFMYFASNEIRYLLQSLYRDKYKYPIVEKIRKENGDTTDTVLIDSQFQEQLKKTRFLGLGNPSESGCHLLYFFRQENGLEKDLFIHGHQAFSRNAEGNTELRSPDVTRYVFIDDFVGSGDQAISYSKELVLQIKELDRSIQIEYLPLFATTEGINHVREEVLFDRVDSIYELDKSYKCFDEGSRYQPTDEYSTLIDWIEVQKMCKKYGEGLVGKDNCLGYDDSQLLLGFNYNTPDNSLPIFWFDYPVKSKWNPFFRRYPKLYGWGES